jgi:hypothetical protein
MNKKNKIVYCACPYIEGISIHKHRNWATICALFHKSMGIFNQLETSKENHGTPQGGQSFQWPGHHSTEWPAWQCCCAWSSCGGARMWTCWSILETWSRPSHRCVHEAGKGVVLGNPLGVAQDPFKATNRYVFLKGWDAEIFNLFSLYRLMWEVL